MGGLLRGLFRIAWLSLALLAGTCASGASGAASQPPVLQGLKAVTLDAASDRLEAAREALARAPAQPLDNGRPEFQAAAGQALWLAIDLPRARDGGEADWVLEVIHPSVRHADLYLPGGDRVALHSGRSVPARERQDARFPATLHLPAQAAGQTVILRLWGPVRLHGRLMLQAHDDWARASRHTLQAMALCFALALLGAAYAVGCAVRARSAAWGLYALLALTTQAAALFITGFGESWLWPSLAGWRGEVSSALAGTASVLALLLAEKTFALDQRAPRLSRVLRVAAALSALATAAALPLPLPLQQLVSHGSAAAAVLLGLVSLWTAWRTVNPAALWLLAGFTPVVAGVLIVTVGVSGLMPFEPWVLLAMPLGAVLELPFNLRGLRALERRQALVRDSLAEVDAALAHNEDRFMVTQRLARGIDAQGATLILVRLQGLAPGSAALMRLDGLALERFVHALMAAAVRPGAHVGRWSVHELAICAPLQDAAALADWASALFASGLRSQRMGIAPQDVKLRLASAQIGPGSPPLAAALESLARLLDDPERADQRRFHGDFRRPAP